MLLRKLIGLAVLAAGPAVANTLIVVGADNEPGENIYIDENGTNKQVWSGGIDIKVDGYARMAYCIELLVNINASTYTTVLDFADTTTNMERVAWLLNNDYPTTAAQGTGFQLAVWDIMTDSGDGFTFRPGQEIYQHQQPHRRHGVRRCRGLRNCLAGQNEQRQHRGLPQHPQRNRCTDPDGPLAQRWRTDTRNSRTGCRRHGCQWTGADRAKPRSSSPPARG